MNKLVQNLFIWLLPFYPIWAWLCLTFTGKIIYYPLGVILNVMAVYIFIFVNKKIPKYLLFFILFTIYHISSTYLTNTFPKNADKLYYIFLLDHNVRACLFFFIIESTIFEESFFVKMKKRLLIIIALSLVVSVIQIKVPTFFFNLSADEDLIYVGENRVFSIYSWLGLNSGGITFPILISILLSIYYSKKSVLPLVVISGIVFSFLTKARYVMISILIALSQLFFNTKISIAKRSVFFGFLILGVILMSVVAEYVGYDINEVINSRILEKGNDMSSAKTRVLSYEVFNRVFPENPLVGVGPETRNDVLALLGGEAVIIHIGYLCYLYFYGIIGCFFLFTAMLFLLKDAWIVGRRDGFWAIFYGLITFYLANFTFVYFNFSEMGIVIALIYMRYYNYQSTLEPDEN